jgi:hypothetical protein
MASGKQAIFGDVLISGTADYAITALRAALKVMDPVLVERYWRQTRGISGQPVINGKRVWTRFRYPDGNDSFISLYPGEHRTTRPSGPEDLILEFEEGPEADSVRDRLTRALDSLADRCPKSEIEELRKLVPEYSSPLGHSVELIKRFDEADALLRDDSADSSDFQKIVQDLLGEGLRDRAFPLLDFSAAITLLQLQAMLGRWIDRTTGDFQDEENGSIYVSPISSLLGYVQGLATLPEVRDIAGTLSEIGNSNYKWAEASLKRALNAQTLHMHCKELELAYYQATVALLIARSTGQAGIACSLQYGEIQAEEDQVSALHGLTHPLKFLFDDPDSLSRYFLDSLSTGTKDFELIGAYSSPQFPLFTKAFVRVLLATARTMDSGETFDRGLRDLEGLESQFNDGLSSIEARFEIGWLDRALLQAYKKKGDTEKVQQYAYKIAAALVVEREFARLG